MKGSRPSRLLELEPASMRPARKGRGARTNPTGRFEKARIEPDLDFIEGPDGFEGPDRLEDFCDGSDRSGLEERDEGRPHPEPVQRKLRTEAIPDPARTAITFNRSPDIPFDASFNPYRGCEHGCAYCYARPTHEFLGYSAGLDFETKILVKYHAPSLLRRELSAPRWKPQVVAPSGWWVHGLCGSSKF